MYNSIRNCPDDAHGGRANAMTNPMKADGHHSNSAPHTGHSFAMIGISAPQEPHSAVFFVELRRLGFCLAGCNSSVSSILATGVSSSSTVKSEFVSSISFPANEESEIPSPM